MSGPIAQSVASLIAVPGVVSLIPAQPHTLVEICCEIFSTIILLPPLIQEGLLSVTSVSISLILPWEVKSDRLGMIISVDWDVKPQTKQKTDNCTT